MDIQAYLHLANEKLADVNAALLSWFGKPETYLQLALIGAAVSLAYICAKFLRYRLRIFRKPEPDDSHYQRQWIIRRISRLFNPFFTIILLTVAEQLSLELIEATPVILQAMQRVAMVWLLWVGLRAFVTNPLILTVGIWILVPAALLQLFGLFAPVVEHLDGYSLTLGETKITAYTVIKGIFFFTIIFWLGKLAGNTGENYIRRNPNLNISTKELLVKLFNIALYATLFMLTLNLIGIDLTALAVFGGALGVGLGFGLQKIASNFISGIILLTERSININNLIEMDDGAFGYVRKLGARASIIETLDGKEVMVPNEDFITSRVANLTHSTTRGRILIPVGVSYNCDIHLAHDVMIEATKSCAVVSTAEGYEPACYLKEYGDSSVNFTIAFWMDDVASGRWRAQSDVMFAVWDALKAHNIEIPFPQRDIHLKSGFETIRDTSKAPHTTKESA